MDDYWSAIRKKTVRAKECVLQNLGKADKTCDNDFAEVKGVFLEQQKNGYKLRDNLRNYLVSIRAANESLRTLHDSMNVMYEPQIGRAEQFKHLTQDSESAWDQYVGRNEKLFQNVNNYCSPFPEIRNKISKRNRKLIDYDSARHSIDALHNSPKKTEASDRLEKSRELYSSLNEQLINEIPELYESRLPFALENFHYFFDDASKFHAQASKLNGEIADLVGQDRDKFKANPPPKREFARSTQNYSGSADAEHYVPINLFQHSLNINQPVENSSHNTAHGPIKEHSLHPYNGNLNEGLLSAVGPPELKYQVTHKYIPTEDNELPLELGDVVDVVPNEYSLPNGWAQGVMERSGQKGLFPINFAKRIH